MGYAGLCVLALIVLATVSPALQRAQQRAQDARFSARIVSIISNWDHLEFQPMATLSLSTEVSNAVQSSGLELTESQLRELERTVRSFFDYIGHPTYEQFIDERTNGGGYRFFITKNLREAALEASGGDTNGFKTDESKIMIAWKRLQDMNIGWGNESLDRLAPASFRLSLVCNTNGIIRTQADAARECTFVIRGFYSGIMHTNSPGSRSETGKRKLFVQLSFVGRFTPSHRASPMYVIWFWSEASQRWRPYGMLFDAQSMYATLF